MSENQIKLSIFNPADKTVDKPRYYFDYMPKQINIKLNVILNMIQMLKNIIQMM